MSLSEANHEGPPPAPNGATVEPQPDMLPSAARAAPYFSICIPQYNRTEFLLMACRSFAAQSFRDFEICISDDLSTDGKAEELKAFLSAERLRHVYHLNTANKRYDANLRSAISLSSGRYLLLMGNDDGLSSPAALAELHAELEQAGQPAVAVCNYTELSSGRLYRRMRETRTYPGSPALAASLFRNYSFVSGVVLDGPQARALASSIVDGSEMYQMYIATRLVAAGGAFHAIDRACIDKDLQITGSQVDSYRSKPIPEPGRIMKRQLPLGRLLEVIGSGLQPFTSSRELDRLLFRSALALYLFTFPFWGIEYRRVSGWTYACGVLLALNPSDLDRNNHLSILSRLILWLVYIVTSAAALAVPLMFFDRLHPLLYRAAKWLRP